MLLNIENGSFARSFGRAPASVSHNLCEHPLLSLESVARLAERLPEDRIEHNLGDLPRIADPRAVRQSDLPVGEIARTIDTNGCWMVLKNIELDADYGRLLDEALDEVDGSIAQREGGMTGREGFIFLSAPGSVTPSHTDPEHNFLLQVRGTKDMNVGRFVDTETEQLALEQALGGGHRNIKWEPHEPRRFRLEPGDGVYVQPHAPHWVDNGSTASVSLSITFQTPANRRTIRVHSLNAKLRRFGMSPAAPGRRPGLDRGKDACSRVIDRVVRS
jgi:hypothetical protein